MLQTHTLRIWNNYCFSTATRVTRTQLNITLDLHWLSSFLSYTSELSNYPKQPYSTQSNLTRPNEVLKAHAHYCSNWTDNGQHKGGKQSNTNQQKAHFYINVLIIVSSTCFEHSSVHPQEDLYIHFLGTSFMHPYEQSGWWQAHKHSSTSCHRPDYSYGCTKEVPRNWMYKSSWGWTLGCSKHVEVTIIKLKD
jgi:hypothetical protein